MTGFEPRPSRVESDRSTNLATTTLPTCFFYKQLFSSLSQLEKFLSAFDHAKAQRTQKDIFHFD